MSTLDSFTAVHDLRERAKKAGRELDAERARADKIYQQLLDYHSWVMDNGPGLDGYRELGARAAAAESERDEARGALKAHARVTERALANVAEASAELERLREALQSTLEIFSNTCRPGMARVIGWRATAIAMGDALSAALAEHDTPAASPGEDGPPAP